MTKKAKILLVGYNIFAIILGIILEIWLNAIENDIYAKIHYIRLLIIEILLLITTNLLFFKGRQIGDKLFTNRYKVGATLIILCTFF